MQLSLCELQPYCNMRNYMRFRVRRGVSDFIGDAFSINYNLDAIRFYKANGECFDVLDARYAEVTEYSNSSKISIVCDHFLEWGGKIECCQKLCEVIAY